MEIAEPPSASEVRREVDLATIRSDKTLQDAIVTSRVPLDVEQYPRSAPRSTALQADGDHWLVIGARTAHGRTQRVEATVDRAIGAGPDLAIHALPKLDCYSFGAPGAKGVAGRDVNLECDLNAGVIAPPIGKPQRERRPALCPRGASGISHLDGPSG